MAQFFDRHQCSQICKSFERPDFENSYIVTGLQPKRGSSYTFELTKAHIKANKDFKDKITLPTIGE